MKIKVKRIHMIGIGGSGMCGIAEVLLNLGYKVSGSDLVEGASVKRLRALGAKIYIGHKESNIQKAQVVVKSTAVKDNNPEIKAAQKKKIPIIPRAEMLAELMRLKTGIAVAGTHGKTTTTSFLGTIFKEAGLDPTVIIGGRLNAFGSNAVLGKGEYFIAEADESDGSFLCLFPIMNVVTNIDADHLDFYPNLEAIKKAFLRFMNAVPFYGLNVVCGDDPNIRELISKIKRPVLTYGFGPDNDLQAKINECDRGSCFEVFWKNKRLGEVCLPHPGEHNILNALAAIGISLEVGIPEQKIFKGLSRFQGVGRRFEIKGEKNNIVVVDDYGHHPTEIEATLKTARQCYPKRRIVVLFQPHRFTRTKALFGEFCQVLQGADLLLLTEIYPASEKPIPGISGFTLAQGIKQMGKDVLFFENFEQVREQLKDILKPGDLFLTLGAGSVYKVGEYFLK
ncbi:UDP-N-acetylmuramate--L-alanine ligase [Desulfonauticus submarinus]|uniref:UDP-N-acetylmuramate--L-alanine ligase n=1 Tax=Desulfonauticus submarinus TaxID=206665 RepID=A0A1H0CTP8_9BACT|nr:UDP-N-acetylmuramate--L-alanine ligase [Desulfonauticus submarinus]SDN61244.1 UDP-N-acetylmuramate--L-alanine ligase [Desulfonauticus submarinus]